MKTTNKNVVNNSRSYSQRACGATTTLKTIKEVHGTSSVKFTINGEQQQIRVANILEVTKTVVTIEPTVVGKMDKISTYRDYIKASNDLTFDNIKDMAIDASVSNGFTLSEALELLSNLCWQYRGSARNAMKRRIKSFLKDPKEVVKFNSELQKEYKTFK